jgi:hypothetical protein
MNTILMKIQHGVLGQTQRFLTVNHFGQIAMVITKTVVIKLSRQNHGHI